MEPFILKDSGFINQKSATHKSYSYFKEDQILWVYKHIKKIVYVKKIDRNLQHQKYAICNYTTVGINIKLVQLWEETEMFNHSMLHKGK